MFWAATGAAAGVAVSQPADATPDLVAAGVWFLKKLPDSAGRSRLATPGWRLLAARVGPDWLLSNVRKSDAVPDPLLAVSVSELRRWPTEYRARAM